MCYSLWCNAPPHDVFFLAHLILDLILEGPEDDLTGVETCYPKNSNIIIKLVVFD